MKRLVAGLFCAILPFISGCESSFLFKPVEKENTTYRVMMRTVSDGSVNYTGDKDLVRQMKARGMQLPMRIRKEQVTVMTTETGARIENDIIPFTTRIDSISSIQFVNGKLQDRDIAAELDTSFRMTGFYKNDTARVEDVEGRNVTPAIRNLMKSVVRQITEAVKFPGRPMKVGDSFSQTLPLNMPMGKMGEMRMEIVTKYTLEKLKSKFADFNLSQTVGLSSGMDSTKFSGSGVGAGKMVFDKTVGRVVMLHTKMTLDMKMKFGPLELITDVDTDTEVRTSVKSR